MAKKAKKTKAKKTKAKAKSAKKAKSRAVKRRRKLIKSVTATASLGPFGPHHFYVRAKVEIPNPRAALRKAVPQGVNPAILILDVVTNERKPGDPPGPRVIVADANYDDRNYTGNYKQVTVRYGRVQSKTVNVQIVI